MAAVMSKGRAQSADSFNCHFAGLPSAHSGRRVEGPARFVPSLMAGGIGGGIKSLVSATQSPGRCRGFELLRL
jgi:hypothetical protein